MASDTHLDLAEMDGAQRAAVLLLLLGEKHGQPIWAMLEEDEVKKVSYAMAQLGSIEPKTVERLIVEFISRLSGGGAVTGSLDRTEELLLTPLSLFLVQAPPDGVELEEEVVDVLRREIFLLGALLLRSGLGHWSSLRSDAGQLVSHPLVSFLSFRSQRRVLALRS